MPSGNVALERGNKVKQAKDGKGNLILLLEEYERRKRKTKQAIKQ